MLINGDRPGLLDRADGPRLMNMSMSMSMSIADLDGGDSLFLRTSCWQHPVLAKRGSMSVPSLRRRRK
ncbi:MAG: hypothetical protein CMP81_10555 [Fulvimarina sp.]|nr:hypothetical protein [Fulvimarina sp.]